jgi:hypothetical protein
MLNALLQSEHSRVRIPRRSMNVFQFTYNLTRYVKLKKSIVISVLLYMQIMD